MMRIDRTIKNLLFRIYGKAGWAREPRQVTLDLTHHCNLRCPFCFYLHGEDPSGERKEPPPSLPFATLKGHVVDRLPTRDYYLTGGEPFLYPDLERLLEYLREKQKRVFVSTNGTLITKAWAEKITRGGLFEKIDISIHGPEEIHDRVSGVPGTYRRVLRGIEWIQEEKRKLGIDRPYVGIACTINGHNIPHLREMARLAKDLALDSLTFGNLSFTTEEKIQHHKTISIRESLGEDFALSQLVIGAPDHGLTQEDVRLYIGTLREIQADCGSSVRVLPVPPYREEEIWKHYFDLDWVYQKECRYPWNTFRLTPSGKVVPCLGVVVGDIHEEGADQIWNGPPLRFFRKKLYRTGLFPGCFRCCKIK